jgi:2,3-dihydroxybiphenyl 1,2-dioxygenase
MSAHPTPILELGYLGIEVSDMPRWRRFAAEVLGMQVEDGPPDAAGQASTRLRIDAAPARVLLLQGPADDCVWAGWRVADAQALSDFCARLTQHGLRWQVGTPAELALRSVRGMVHFADPAGNRHEVFWGQAGADTPFASPQVAKGFVTGAGGMGHIVYEVPDPAAERAFAEQVLGLRLSDTILAEPVPGVRIEFAFFHANERNHSFAFGPRPPRPGPVKRVHHFMLEVHDVTEVGRARDRCLAFGQPITMDIGEHPNDRMVSFYAQTPSGIHVEFGCNGLRVDEARWVPQVHQGISLWGHKPRTDALPKP